MKCLQLINRNILLFMKSLSSTYSLSNSIPNYNIYHNILSNSPSNLFSSKKNFLATQIEKEFKYININL